MKSLSIMMAAAGFGLAACATGSQPVTDAQIAEAIPDWTRTGETMNCVGLIHLDEIEPVTERVWLFEMRNGTTYLNVVSSGCNDADSAFTYLTYETPTGQLCSNEIVRVMDQSSDMLSGSCSINEFERLAPR